LFFLRGLCTKKIIIAGSAVLTLAQPHSPLNLEPLRQEVFIIRVVWVADEKDLSLEGKRGGSCNGMKGGGNG